ncbi:MAG: 5-formyltetrahydrofolate cyclo-ligase [Bacteroidia bacterium]
MSSDIKREKRELRAKMAQTAKLLSPDYFAQKDQLLLDKLGQHELVKRANCILSYWSMPKEAATQQLNQNWIATKQVLLPVINGAELMLKNFEGKSKMVQEPKYGIWEPNGIQFTAYDKIDLVIVPGVAFTKSGLRCGHGKGYYDKLLPKLKNAYKLGIAYDFQKVQQLPTNQFDITLNQVLFV